MTVTLMFGWLSQEIRKHWGRRQVWDAAGQAYIRYEAEDVGEENIGHVVENSRIVAAAVAQLQALTPLVLITRNVLCQCSWSRKITEELSRPFANSSANASIIMFVVVLMRLQCGAL